MFQAYFDFTELTENIMHFCVYTEPIGFRVDAIPFGSPEGMSNEVERLATPPIINTSFYLHLFE